MGQKMLYIREEDEILFEEGVKMTGNNFSAALAKIVRHYVESKHMETSGLKEVTINEGFKSYIPDVDPSTVREKKFIGKTVIEYTEPKTEDEYESTEWKIFLTRKEKIVIQRSYIEPTGVAYAYYILERLPSDGLLESGDLHPSDYYPSDNGDALVTTYKVMIPRTLLLEAKKRLGENTAVFMDI